MLGLLSFYGIQEKSSDIRMLMVTFDIGAYCQLLAIPDRHSPRVLPRGLIFDCCTPISPSKSPFSNGQLLMSRKVCMHVLKNP